jgi:hypothetical protein
MPVRYVRSAGLHTFDKVIHEPARNIIYGQQDAGRGRERIGNLRRRSEGIRSRTCQTQDERILTQGRNVSRHVQAAYVGV